MKKLFCIILLTINVAFAGPRVRGNGGQAHGCVTADTLITLSNGNEVTISSLKAGDIVLNNNNQEVQVFYTLEGLEAKQMYNIETESGKKIKATEGHPFYSNEGLVVSKNIKAGSDILTIDGLEKVVRVSKFDFNGLVYNLATSNIENNMDSRLELSDPFLGLSSKEHTVILNGFISGDIIIQRLMAM